MQGEINDSKGLDVIVILNWLLRKCGLELLSRFISQYTLERSSLN